MHVNAFCVSGVRNPHILFSSSTCIYCCLSLGMRCYGGSNELFCFTCHESSSTGICPCLSYVKWKLKLFYFK